MGPLAFHDECDPLGHLLDRAQRILTEHVPGEHADHSDDAAIHEERVAGEGRHSLPPRPLLIADLRIVWNVVGQVWPLVAGNASDLVLAHGDA